MILIHNYAKHGFGDATTSHVKNLNRNSIRSIHHIVYFYRLYIIWQLVPRLQIYIYNIYMYMEF